MGGHDIDMLSKNQRSVEGAPETRTAHGSG
jgi:hypothetical protein